MPEPPPLATRRVPLSWRGVTQYLTGRATPARQLNDLCVAALLPQLTGDVIELGATPQGNHRRYATRSDRYVLSNVSGEDGCLHLDAMAMNLPGDSVGNFVAAQVFEHIPRPWQAVAEIHRVLRRHGKVLIVTPFLYPFHAAPGDYYRYTNEGLVSLLERFRILHVESLGNLWTTCAVLLQHPHGAAPPERRSAARHLAARTIVMASRALGLLFYVIGTLRNRANDYPTLYAVLAEKTE